MKTCPTCGRDYRDDAVHLCKCEPAIVVEPRLPVEYQSDQLQSQSMALQRLSCPPPCIRAGYEFVSKRAEARLSEPLMSALRQLNIRPKSLPRVTQFMEQRLHELKFPRKPRLGLHYALLGVLAGTCIATFYTCEFIYAWLIMWVLLIPACFLVLHIAKKLRRTSKPYAEWAEEEFWPQWNMGRRKRRAIPREILMVAEEVQTQLPSSRLTVYHLYEDAFLCARHSGILGADDELYILEHWGSRDFEQ